MRLLRKRMLSICLVSNYFERIEWDTVFILAIASRSTFSLFTGTLPRECNFLFAVESGNLETEQQIR